MTVVYYTSKIGLLFSGSSALILFCVYCVLLSILRIVIVCFASRRLLSAQHILTTFPLVHDVLL